MEDPRYTLDEAVRLSHNAMARMLDDYLDEFEASGVVEVVNGKTIRITINANPHGGAWKPGE